MNTLTLNNCRKGSIIVIALVMLLVMTTMGVGLLYSTKHTAKQIGVSGNRTETFYTAESCVTEAVNWLENEAINGAPCKNTSVGNICHSITNKAMSKWELSGEKQMHNQKMSAQKYRCNIYLLGAIAFQGEGETGFDVGESDTYGKAKTNTKYLYKINSVGFSGDLKSEVEVITSMIF